jgi:hypothetical protein
MENKCNAERLFDALKPDYWDTSYNPKTRAGYANLGFTGIHFHESGNDPAVIITLVSPPRFKGTDEGALAFIEALRAAFFNSD